MSTSNPIQLVTFDLDNTLWDVGKVVGGAEMKMRDWLAEQDPAVHETYLGEQTADRRQRLVTDNPSLKHDLSALRTAIMRATALAAGRTPAAANHLAEAAFEVFITARHEVEYFEGAIEVLSALSQRYTLGALTNGNAAIDRLGLDKYFTFAFCSADVGASKPAPNMFHAALKHSGVAPERAVHIGDHLVDDIAGASAVGMRTILVEIKEHTRMKPDAQPGTPTGRVSHLSELIDHIALL